MPVLKEEEGENKGSDSKGSEDNLQKKVDKNVAKCIASKNPQRQLQEPQDNNDRIIDNDEEEKKEEQYPPRPQDNQNIENRLNH